MHVSFKKHLFFLPSFLASNQKKKKKKEIQVKKKKKVLFEKSPGYICIKQIMLLFH